MHGWHHVLLAGWRGSRSPADRHETLACWASWQPGPWCLVAPWLYRYFHLPCQPMFRHICVASSSRRQHRHQHQHQHQRRCQQVSKGQAQKAQRLAARFRPAARDLQAIGTRWTSRDQRRSPRGRSAWIVRTGCSSRSRSRSQRRAPPRRCQPPRPYSRSPICPRLWQRWSHRTTVWGSRQRSLASIQTLMDGSLLPIVWSCRTL